MSIKAKTWELVLYPDCDRHQEVLDELILNSSTDCNYIGILHDRDVNADGSTKKPHWHWVFCFDNDTSLGTCEKLFPNIEHTMWTAKNNRKESIKYLTHSSKNAIADGKPRYDKSLCIGNQTFVSRYLGADHENNLSVIMDYIEYTNPRELTYTNLLRWCIKEGYTETLRKYSYLLKEVISEQIQINNSTTRKVDIGGRKNETLEN